MVEINTVEITVEGHDFAAYYAARQAARQAGAACRANPTQANIAELRAAMLAWGREEDQRVQAANDGLPFA